MTTSNYMLLCTHCNRCRYHPDDGKKIPAKEKNSSQRVMEISEGLAVPSDRPRRAQPDYFMRYANLSVKIVKSTHSHYEKATFRRKARTHYTKYVKKRSAESKAKHGEFTCLVVWWHSLTDKPSETTPVTASKEYWLNGAFTYKEFEFWQGADEAMRQEPQDKPLKKKDREAVFEGRLVAVYENIKIGAEDDGEPAPHKYNPNSGDAARAGRSNDAIVLGSNFSFRRSAIVTGNPLAKRMTLKGKMMGAATAPKPKLGYGSGPRSSLWSDAGRNGYETSAAWQWTQKALQTQNDDTQMTDAHGDSDEPWSISAEPRHP